MDPKPRPNNNVKHEGTMLIGVLKQVTKYDGSRTKAKGEKSLKWEMIQFCAKISKRFKVGARKNFTI